MKLALTKGKMNSEWVFPITDVQVSDQILGRGSFGEVRVGKWRSISVACKTLHTNVGTEDVQEVIYAMGQEMDILSKLRHPNLVLFLGVCCDPADLRGSNSSLTCLPSMILTELMPCSLYDIIEGKKVKLSMAEILDISLDVSYGLQYLHSYNPAIIHRDISSKNILIGGNRAKIADLGQAKIFGSSVMSRQTSMPGAFAYSAPEVMTGRYSTKIDVFSFGVLLIQLASGVYPKIEKRDQQLSSACESHPQFSSLMVSSVSFQPDDRPTISQAIIILEGIKNNDRFYPPVRRLPPQSDVGVMTRKWMNDQIEATNCEMKVQYEQNSKALIAEAQRLVDEVTRSDVLEKKVAEMSVFIEGLVDTSNRRGEELNESRTKIVGLTDTLDVTAQRLQRSEGEKVRLLLVVEELEAKLLAQSLKLSRATAANAEYTRKIEQYQQSFTGLESAGQKALVREKETKIYLDLQVDQNQELEARLEQALRRWKQEKETSNLETEKYIKMRTTSASLVEQLERAQAELIRLADRLGQYDNLPLPDEIRIRLKDMGIDLERTTQQLLEQRKGNEELREQTELSDNKINILSALIEEKDTIIDQNIKNIDEKNTANSSMQSHLAAVVQELHFNRKKLQELEDECSIYADNEIVLTAQLKESEESLEREAKRFQIIGAAFNQNNQNNQNNGGNKNRPPSGTNRNNEQSNTSNPNNNTNSNSESKTESVSELVPGSEGSGSRQLSVRFREEGGVSDEQNSPMRASPTDELMEGGALSDRAVKRRIELLEAEGGVGGLIKLLKENIDSERISWRVPRALREQVVKDEAMRKECMDLQCDELLLVSLQTFPNSAMVQAQVLRLLGTIAYGNDQMRRRTGEKGVIRMILSAMTRFNMGDESVLLHSLTALTNLMHTSLENRSRFLDASGVEALITCMESHKDSAVLQRQSCWTILTLAGSDEASRAVVQAGGASVIINAMLLFRDDTGVQQFGCWALSNLCLAGEDMCRRLKKLGGLEVCRMAIERHGGDMEVTRQARQLYGYLTSVK